jgi:hypothetical protein
MASHGASQAPLITKGDRPLRFIKRGRGYRRTTSCQSRPVRGGVIGSDGQEF